MVNLSRMIATKIKEKKGDITEDEVHFKILFILYIYISVIFFSFCLPLFMNERSEMFCKCLVMGKSVYFPFDIVVCIGCELFRLPLLSFLSSFFTHPLTLCAF